MSNRELKKALVEGAKQKPGALLSVFVVLLSLGFGWFTYYYDGYLIANVEPYFSRVPEDLIGMSLVLFSVIKGLGVMTSRTVLKRIGILGMSATWTGILVLALTFSFGSGYPNPSYQFMGFVTAICFTISLKGDFD